MEMFKINELFGGFFDPEHSYETALKANRRISNIEPQNVEGWNRCAQSFLKNNNDRIPYSMLDVQCSMFIFSLTAYETISFFSGETIRISARRLG
jgi:hypothetical protein